MIPEAERGLLFRLIAHTIIMAVWKLHARERDSRTFPISHFEILNHGTKDKYTDYKQERKVQGEEVFSSQFE